MNKNLLRVIVYVGYVLVVVGLTKLVYQIIPIQPHEDFFTTMGMVRLVINCLIMFSSIYAVNLILRKYGAQFSSATPREKTILWIVTIFLIFMLFFGPYLFFNGKLPF